LVDPIHVHHGAAEDWFEAHATQGWASCPITENGFVRILGSPGYANGPADGAAALNLLRELCAVGGHEFWPDEVSIRQLLPADQLLSPSQVTDLYLLGLAAHRSSRLATFDRRLRCAAIPGGSDALELISA